MTAYQHRVRYHEADAQGFMFNARYLELADVAMTELFRALGWPYADLVADGTDPSVVSAGLTFSKPARFDDLLDVDVRCTRVGTSSFHLAVKVSRGPDAIATIQLVYVNVDPVSATSRPLPEEVAAALRAAAGEPGRTADKR
jgi:acyl-CoA thioester hydrolase